MVEILYLPMFGFLQVNPIQQLPSQRPLKKKSLVTNTWFYQNDSGARFIQ